MSLAVTQLIGFGARRAAPAGSSPAVSYVANGGKESPSSTDTYSAQSLGAAASDRYIILGYYGLVLGAAPGCTIGGVSATNVRTFTDSTVVCALYIAAVPTGTTGDIVFTSSAANRQNWVAWRATGLTSATAAATADTGSTATGTSFAVTAGGIIVGFAATNLGSSSNIAWTGVTEDAEGTTTNTRYGGGSTVAGSSSGSYAITATFTGSTNAPRLITATWN